MKETRTSDLAENSSRIGGKALGEYGSIFAFERAARIQVIRTVEYPPHHVPLRQTE
jgi:hypothetical protein